MKLKGIGVDIVKNKRIYNIFKKYKIKFAKKILNSNELKIFKKKKNKIFFLAKSFAAKEAVAKSLGTGFRNDICFKNIEIKKNKFGCPKIKINIDNIKKKYKTYISISHEKKLTIAFAIIIEKN